MDDRERDHALEPLKLAEDEGAVRPGAGERDDEMVAARLRLEAAGAAWSRFAARGHPVAERRVGPHEMAGRVVGEVALSRQDPLTKWPILILRQLQVARATCVAEKDWLTGISSSRLMLRWGGSSATQRIVAAMSSPVIGFTPR